MIPNTCGQVLELSFPHGEEDGRAPSLRRFSAAVAAHSGLPTSALALDDWEPLLRSALAVTQRTSATPLVVIDELPYLLRHSPEIPGLLQHIYDESRFGQPDAPGGRLILCGSAMSVMNELLSGTKPLRGRSVLDLRLAAFDYRDARRMWQIEDRYTALLVHSVLADAPGYRALADAPAPQSEAEFPAWVQATVLDPMLALHSRAETEYLLREAPGSPTARCTTTFSARWRAGRAPPAASAACSAANAD